jgi:hypothetical protein
MKAEVKAVVEFGGHFEKTREIVFAPDVQQVQVQVKVKVQAPVNEQPRLSSAQLALERRCQGPWDERRLAV